MPLPALWAACMPAHAEALNDLSSMPPVSVTMQPRVLPAAAAELPEPAAGVDEVAPAAGAELVLLPHAAMTTDAATASAAVAHALCFTLTSTGPARHSAWPRISPRLSRRLCLVVFAGKGTRGYLACSLPNRNPIMMAFLAWQTEIRGFRAGSLVPSYKAPGPASRGRERSLQAGEILRGCGGLRGRAGRRRDAGEVQDDGQPATRPLGQPGRAAVRGDQAVHDGQAEPGAVRVRGGEAQEGPLPVLGAHARAVVGHDDPGPGRGGRRGHRNVTARAQRVERVGDEVIEDLLQVTLADPGQHRRPGRGDRKSTRLNSSHLVI